MTSIYKMSSLFCGLLLKSEYDEKGNDTSTPWRYTSGRYFTGNEPFDNPGGKRAGNKQETTILSKKVNETASISVEMAVRLQQAFGVNAEFWLDLQKKHDIWKIEKSGLLHIKPFAKTGELAEVAKGG